MCTMKGYTDRATPFESKLQLASCSFDSNGMARSVYSILNRNNDFATIFNSSVSGLDV